jgi:hypothetical protein
MFPETIITLVKLRGFSLQIMKIHHIKAWSLIYSLVIFICEDTWPDSSDLWKHRTFRDRVFDIVLLPCNGNLTDWLLGTEFFLRSKEFLSYSRNCANFMEIESSLPHLQQPATCSYPDPDRSSLCPSIFYSLQSILVLSSCYDYIKNIFISN